MTPEYAKELYTLYPDAFREFLMFYWPGIGNPEYREYVKTCILRDGTSKPTSDFEHYFDMRGLHIAVNHATDYMGKLYFGTNVNNGEEEHIANDRDDAKWLAIKECFEIRQSQPKAKEL